jgi:DNA-binding FadR family transcriptional regulator
MTETARNRGDLAKTPRVKPQKTAMLVAQRIVAEIADNGLEPGAMLPPEREMQVKYEVARGTLREALRFLEMQGVLTIKSGPGGGPVVSSPDPRYLASMLALVLQMSGAQYRTILEARQLLEPALAAQAATRISEPDLKELRASVERMEGELQTSDAFLAENRFFHALIARAAGNQLFEYLLASVAWITDGTALGVEYSLPHRAAVRDAHQRVLDAIEARDTKRAEETMRDHIQEFATYLERHYSHIMEKQLRWDHALQ